jgi:hypothetical protein
MADSYDWTFWEKETDLDNDDDRENVYYLTITENGEEYAVIIHRASEQFPIDGDVANAKILRAQQIVEALNYFSE